MEKQFRWLGFKKCMTANYSVNEMSLSIFKLNNKRCNHINWDDYEV